MQSVLFTIIALFMGVLLSIYLPMNSMVSRHLGSVIAANITFFFIALITSIIIFWIWGNHGALARIITAPKYLYIAGFISALNILGTTYLIPKIGIRRFFILVVAGQILSAIFVGHFGWLASPKDPISLKKIIGALLLVAGAVFSTY